LEIRKSDNIEDVAKIIADIITDNEENQISEVSQTLPKTEEMVL
jgi:hypothetical protein